MVNLFREHALLGQRFAQNEYNVDLSEAIKAKDFLAVLISELFLALACLVFRQMFINDWLLAIKVVIDTRSDEIDWTIRRQSHVLLVDLNCWWQIGKGLEIFQTKDSF